MTAAMVSMVACTPLPLAKNALVWPRADEVLSTSQRVEIERLLNRLGYMRGGIDGAITRNTRAAIQTYQRDVGAPVSGYVSRALLASLRNSAGVSAPAPAAAASPAPKPKAAAPKPAAPKPAAAPAAPAASTGFDWGDEDDGEDDGGGSGGDDGGGWG